MDSNIPKYSQAARMFCYRYNQTPPEDLALREEILRQNLAHVGRDVLVLSPFQCDLAYNIHLGDNVFINYNCVILDMNRITIGNNVMIAPNVTISAATHPLSAVERRSRKCLTGEIVIEDDVWIGCNAAILPGVRIGRGSIVGAGAVVNRDVPPHSVVAGVPARIIRTLEEEVSQKSTY